MKFQKPPNLLNLSNCLHRAHEQAKDVPVAGSALACPHGATNKTRCFPRAEIYEPGKTVLTFEGLEVAEFLTVMQQVSTS